jgi:protein phosphatase
MGLILRTAVLSDLGLRRGNNEDSAYAGRRLLVVADGMGGLPAGELASDLAVGALTELEAAAGAGTPSGEDLVAALRAAFDAASERIRAAAAQDDAVRYGMGTTVTALLFSDDLTARVAIMHVGDSRGYLFRDGVLTQLTKDDTYVQALVDRGVLTPDGARRHPQRSLVTQAMQGQPLAPFSTTLEPRAGDVFLLCSDGLSDVVPDDEMAQLIGSRADLRRCAERLVDAAVAAGGPDNVTVVLGELAAG